MAKLINKNTKFIDPINGNMYSISSIDSVEVGKNNQVIMKRTNSDYDVWMEFDSLEIAVKVRDALIKSMDSFDNGEFVKPDFSFLTMVDGGSSKKNKEEK
jgi:hypothetical protein